MGNCPEDPVNDSQFIHMMAAGQSQARLTSGQFLRCLSFGNIIAADG